MKELRTNVLAAIEGMAKQETDQHRAGKQGLLQNPTMGMFEGPKSLTVCAFGSVIELLTGILGSSFPGRLPHGHHDRKVGRMGVSCAAASAVET